MSKRREKIGYVWLAWFSKLWFGTCIRLQCSDFPLEHLWCPVRLANDLASGDQAEDVPGSCRSSCRREDWRSRRTEGCWREPFRKQPGRHSAGRPLGSASSARTPAEPPPHSLQKERETDPSLFPTQSSPASVSGLPGLRKHPGTSASEGSSNVNHSAFGTAPSANLFFFFSPPGLLHFSRLSPLSCWDRTAFNAAVGSSCLVFGDWPKYFGVVTTTPL